MLICKPQINVQPPIPVLYQIADILNVDVRELLVSNKRITK